MKRLINVGMVLLFLVALSGCGSNSVPATAEPTVTPTSTPTAKPTPQQIVIAPELTAEPTIMPTEVPTPSPQPDILNGFVIGIDAGHQAKGNPEQEPIAPESNQTKSKASSGTRGVQSRVYEYEVNLAVALLLRDRLEASGATVVMVRTDNDVNISNAERAIMFNEAMVDLGMRIHCNGSDNPNTRGAFMLVPHPSCTDWYEENLRAASCIINSYCALTGFEMRGASGGITERSDQTGFNWCSRPIVNIEMGHLTNAEEDLLLTSTDFQNLMAAGIYDGIVDYFTKGL